MGKMLLLMLVGMRERHALVPEMVMLTRVLCVRDECPIIIKRHKKSEKKEK